MKKFAYIIQQYFFDPLIVLFVAAFIACVRGFYVWLSWDSFWLCAGALTLTTACFCIIFHANRSLWRYTSSLEYLALIASYFCGFTVVHLLLNIGFKMPVSVLFMFTATSVSLLTSLTVRIAFKYWYHRVEKNRLGNRGENEKRSMIILGAGAAGAALTLEIYRNHKSPFNVVAILDDDVLKIGHEICGVKVSGKISTLPELLADRPNADVVLAAPSMSLERRKEIISMCTNLPCKFLIMPDTLQIMEAGNCYTAAIRAVKIEDLLSRTSIIFDRNELDTLVAGKTVLVTGGGGSIGSELCRQISSFGAARVIVFDMNENDSYILYRSLKHLFGNSVFIKVEIGNIVDERRVDEIFRNYRPDIVFHAAAHKHVPLMEDCPYECVQNNIFGTYNLLSAARRYHVPKFVLISTDKAVNPTNIMGASKRYCERLSRAFACMPDCDTDFVAVRFGNVLGSHGSVIPLFQMQLQHGGPITVTDRRVTRYFMTIPEAAGLVIKAASMAERSETYILDMGKPVRIWELAENFVRLSGYKPYEEVQIIETGLRPGEKLYEELLVNTEEHQSTTASKIFVEKNQEQVRMCDVEEEMALLRTIVATQNNDEIIHLMRTLVPNFRDPEDVNAEYEERKREEAGTNMVGA